MSIHRLSTGVFGCAWVSLATLSPAVHAQPLPLKSPDEFRAYAEDLRIQMGDVAKLVLLIDKDKTIVLRDFTVPGNTSCSGKPKVTLKGEKISIASLEVAVAVMRVSNADVLAGRETKVRMASAKETRTACASPTRPR